VPGRPADGGHGHRELNQVAPIESGRRRAALLCRNLVLPDILIGQFDRDLEFDRDQVVAADLPGPSGRDEALYGGKPLFSQRFLACARMAVASRAAPAPKE
jgi:hypothetical protein